MRCIENVIEYLSKTGYAYMAISGQPFCKSAWNGFLLNMKYCAKFYFAHSIASMFVFIGILFITGSNLLVGVFLVNYVTKEVDDPEIELRSTFIIFLILSIFVASVCLGLFDDAVVVILQCYAVDADLHYGKPKFGPTSYHEKLKAIYGDDDEDKGGETGQVSVIAAHSMV